MFLHFQGYEVVSAKPDFGYLVRILLSTGTACMLKDNVVAITLHGDVLITCEYKTNLPHFQVHTTAYIFRLHTRTRQRLMRIQPTQYTEVNEPPDAQCVPENSSPQVKEVTGSPGGES